MENRNIWISVLILLAVGLAIFLVLRNYDGPEGGPAGSPGEDIENITEKITYVNATPDLIQVELPFPGAVVGKEFYAIGKARGNWYFEASFPVTVLDMNGDALAQTYATAQGEWMTTNLVPFKSQPIKIPESYIGPATLVLHKDNASGLPEHDASISFPIIIEY